MKTLALAAVAALVSAASPASAALLDASFETQGSAIVQANGICYFSGSYNGPACPTGAWTGTGPTSGLLNERNGGFGGRATSAGSYYGFIQSYNGQVGTLNQTFTVDADGLYTLNWLAAGRSSGMGNLSYEVRLSGGGATATLFTGATTSDQDFARSSAPGRALTRGTYTLSFAALNSGGDNSAFIDDVRLEAAVPEPATWGLMLAGFGLIGAGLRARGRSVAFA